MWLWYHPLVAYSLSFLYTYLHLNPNHSLSIRHLHLPLHFPTFRLTPLALDSAFNFASFYRLTPFFRIIPLFLYATTKKTIQNISHQIIFISINKQIFFADILEKNIISKNIILVSRSERTEKIWERKKWKESQWEETEKKGYQKNEQKNIVQQKSQKKIYLKWPEATQRV